MDQSDLLACILISVGGIFIRLLSLQISLKLLPEFVGHLALSDDLLPLLVGQCFVLTQLLLNTS